MALLDNIKDLAKDFHADVIGYREHLHANPELSLKEQHTAQFIAKRLKDFGVEFEEGIAKTGIVGLLRGGKDSNKVIALRADMDALPITETNDVGYVSKNKEVMHACGHDVHMASL